MISITPGDYGRDRERGDRVPRRKAVVARREAWTRLPGIPESAAHWHRCRARTIDRGFKNLHQNLRVGERLHGEQPCVRHFRIFPDNTRNIERDRRGDDRGGRRSAGEYIVEALE